MKTARVNSGGLEGCIVEIISGPRPGDGGDSLYRIKVLDTTDANSAHTHSVGFKTDLFAWRLDLNESHRKLNPNLAFRLRENK